VWEAGGAPAYWPWTQVIRQLVEDRPFAELEKDLGWAAPYVAQIAPDVARRLEAAAPQAPPLDSDAARFTAFDATT
jgi:eukaryotic-like serine/threonine-protein kinase